MPYAIDLFSGAGGMSEGIIQAGFHILFSSDINEAVQKTYVNRHKQLGLIQGVNTHFELADIKDLTGDSIRNSIANLDIFKNKEIPHIDAIFGGPPCQGFSVFGKRRFINTQEYDPHTDPRNALVYQYIRLVKELRPKFFFMENVKGFTNLDKGLFVDNVKRQFMELGYNNIWCEIICAADYGVPQERYRMFMIGNRLGIEYEKPLPTHFPIDSDMTPKYITVGETIMDLVGKENKIPNHVPLVHKPVVAARYGYVKEGCKLNIDDLPPELAVATRKDSKTGKVANYSHVYKRLDRTKPSTTMVPGHNAFPIHPTLNRTLTAREAARIQTFPDTHIFTGTRQEQCIQVGNAVPPKMAEPFIMRIKEYLEKGG